MAVRKARFDQIKLNECPELTAASLLKKKMDVYAFIRYTRKAKSTTIDKIIEREIPTDWIFRATSIRSVAELLPSQYVNSFIQLVGIKRQYVFNANKMGARPTRCSNISRIEQCVLPM